MLISGNVGPNGVLPYSNPGMEPLGQSPQFPAVQGFRLYLQWPLSFASYAHWGSEANSFYDSFSAPNIVSGGNVTPNGTTLNDASNTNFDSGVNFDGSTGYLKGTTNNASPTGSADRSFCCWLQVPNFTKLFYPFTFGGTTGFTDFALYIGKTGGVAGQTVGSPGLDALSSQAFAGNAITTGVPFHVAVSVSSTLSTALFYINGVRQTTTTNGSGTFNVTGGQPYYFDNLTGQAAEGAGTIWDARIYDRILSAADVYDIYAAGVAGKQAIYSPATELPILMPPSSTTDFRKTLSGIGGRIGTRQIQSWG